MTDIQTTTAHDTGPPSATGHLESPLFALLPVELRLKIYEDVFDGSRAGLVYCRWYGAPNHDETHDYPNYLYMLRQSGLHRPLLTCRALYEEAMTLYWSHTVIDTCNSSREPSATDYHYPSIGPSRKPSATDDHYPSIGDAVCAIPVHARQYIQHITNVQYPEGTKAHGGPYGWWLAKGISYLPSLKTCRLVDVIEMDPYSQQYSPSGIGYEIGAADQGRRCGSYDGHQYLDRDEFLVEHCRSYAGFRHLGYDPVLFEEPYFAAVVIQKYSIRHADPEAIRRDPHAYRRRELGTHHGLSWPQLVQEGFINHTTRRIYHTIVDSKVVNPSDDLSDDCAFQRAIGDPSLVTMWPIELNPREIMWSSTPLEVGRAGVSLERTDTKSRFNVEMPTKF